MPDILLYLIKANVAIVLFYLGYRLLLRKLTFYHLNRFYLIFAVLFSACYPLVDLPKWLEGGNVVVSEVVYALPEWEVSPVEAISPWAYVLWIIGLVSVFFCLRFLVRLGSLWVIHKQSSPSQWRLFRYRQVFRPVNPFSFWRTIYLNVQQYEQLELEDIFQHEQVHVDELHTFDILLAELLSILCWFNPGVWLLRHAVRENLEFITDRQVLESGIDKKAYQYSLLRASTVQYNPALASNFNLKSIKRRIAMMNAGRSSRLQLGKYVLAVPAIALFVLVFTITNAKQDMVHVDMNYTKLTSGDTVYPSEPTLQEEALEETMNDDVITQVTISTHENIPLDTPANRRVSIRMVSQDSTEGNPLYILDGVEMHDQLLSKMDPDQIHSIHVLKGSSATSLYGDRGANGAVLISSKKNASHTSFSAPNLNDSLAEKVAMIRLAEPGNRNLSAPPRADTAQRVIRALKGRVVGIDANTPDLVVTGRVDTDVAADNVYNALILIDGEQVSSADFRSLSPDQIKTVTVLKGEAAFEKYGDKGKHGVIEIEVAH